MNVPDPTSDGLGEAAAGPSAAGELLDVLSVAAVVLDAEGRVVLWSPQAEELFGFTTEEALGQFAGRLLVREEHLELVSDLFARVMARGGSWAGVFPVLHKDGGTRLVEFRNMRLRGDKGDLYALGLAAEQSTVRAVERDLALSARLFSQSPVGIAVLDPDLRFVTVNPALERINGIPAAGHTGRRVRDVLPFPDVKKIESAMRQVLETGVPLVDHNLHGRTRASPARDQAWSTSYYRLETAGGEVLGLAASVVDVTHRYQAAMEVTQARQRLAMIANASVLIGSTLDLERTAHELADFVVPGLADLAAVDILDTALATSGTPGTLRSRPMVFRALAVVAAHPTEAVRASDPVGAVASYAADRLVTRCVTTGAPALVPHVTDEDLVHIARSSEAAALLARTGFHSYLAVPLIARGHVLGTLDLKRIRNPLPFDDDDVALARELANRAAVCVDNALGYQRERDAALTLQRSLLPQHPPPQPGLEIAHRYQPAGAASEVGGDWFDVIPLTDDTTALVIGDVMGSGISAAATMGQLSNAIRTLAGLGLDPGDLMQHVDRSSTGLEQTTATCLYAVYDPHHHRCRISNAGHLPPIRTRPGRPPELLDLPTGVPLGVGGFSFDAVTIDLYPGDRLVLYTDGLVETRDQPIDARLNVLLSLLDTPGRPLEKTCDELLHHLSGSDNHDDVTLLIAQVQPHRT